MTKLSVNLNKIALLRNSRETSIPSVTDAAVTAIESGALGITVHPRPDQRHIRPQDVHDLAELLADPQYKHIEFNIEGNPFAGPETNGYPGFMALVTEVRPHQCTLVPDDPGQLTSDHGWDLQAHQREGGQLSDILAQLKAVNCRISLFMDPDEAQISLASELGTDRIEFYTGPYSDVKSADVKSADVKSADVKSADVKSADAKSADAKSAESERILTAFINAARHADSVGLGINAGHDLNQQNLAEFCRRVPGVLEVSIGHAIIADALWLGLGETIKRYRDILDSL